MRQFLTAALIVLVAGPAFVAGPAWAGGTKIKSSLVPVVSFCPLGLCVDNECGDSGHACDVDLECLSCNLTHESCSSNADCDEGSLSIKSQVQITGAGQLKVKIKDLVDGSGALVTTDGAVNSADDYVMLFQLGALSGPTQVIAKLEFTKGKGTFTLDLNPFMPAVGTAVTPVAILYTPPVVPASCPGTNSVADIQAREEDEDCRSGTPIGLMGVLVGS